MHYYLKNHTIFKVNVYICVSFNWHYPKEGSDNFMKQEELISFEIDLQLQYLLSPGTVRSLRSEHA